MHPDRPIISVSGDSAIGFSGMEMETALCGNKAEGFPFRGSQGLVTMFAVEGNSPRGVALASIGGWPQGFACFRDGCTLLAQSMTTRAIDGFRVDGGTLTKVGPIKANRGAAEALAPA